MRYQRKCAKIIINRHYFRHKSEIDSDNQMILYYNMVEAAGVEPVSANMPSQFKNPTSKWGQSLSSNKPESLTPMQVHPPTFNRVGF